MASSSATAAASVPPVPNRGTTVFIVTTTTIVLSILFVIARLASRFLVRRLHWDDFAIVLACLIAFGLALAVDLGTGFGLGKHDVDISDQDKGYLKRCEYVFSVMFNPALTATKTSLLIFYLRISKESNKVLYNASCGVLIIVLVAGTGLTTMNILQCQPVHAAFEVVPGKCISQLTKFMCAAPVNVVTNLAILALPIPVLTGLRLPGRQKAILVFTFGLGIFTTIVDVLRIYYFQAAIISFASPSYGFQSPNFAWDVAYAFMWSGIEINVGIICACIPFLKPLVLRILPGMLYTPESTPITSDSQGTCVMNTPPQYKSDERTSGPTGAVGNSETQVPPTGHTQPNHTNRTEASMMTSPTLPDWAGPISQHHSWRDHCDYNPDPATIPDRHISNQGGQRGLTPSPTLHPNRPRENSVFFGFMHIPETKNILEASVVDSFKYCILITIVFFLWGFVEGILKVFNDTIITVYHFSLAIQLGIEALYVGGYFFGPLLGRWILRCDEHDGSFQGHPNLKQEGSVRGFKATIIVGICIYGIGTIMSWPSAVLSSRTGLMVSGFVIGLGSGVLFTGVVTFIALCGPSQYSELRLCVAWGFQLVGDILGWLLAEHVLLANLKSKIDNNPGHFSPMVLLNTQWTYLSIVMFATGLALLLLYVPLPEVSDAEMENATESLPVDTKKGSVFGLRLQTLSLTLAVFSHWTCFAAIGIFNAFFDNLLIAFAPSSIPPSALQPSLSGKVSWLQISLPHFFIVSTTASAVSRFAAGFLSYLHVKRPQCRLIPAPRTVFLLSVAGCLVCAVLLVAVRPAHDPNLSVIRIIFFYFFWGPLTPLIYATGLRGQGKRTKSASAYIAMGISSSSIWWWAAYAITENSSVLRVSYVVIALMVVSGVYPLFLMFSPSAKLMVDPVPSPLPPRGENRELDVFEERDGERVADLDGN